MRHRIVVIALVAMVCSGCWTQFRGDAAHTGFQPLELSVSRTNVSTLTSAWVGSGHGAVMHSSPTVAGGKVYAGFSDGSLVAFDAAGVSGCTIGVCDPLWSAKTGDDIVSTPAVADGRVFVGSLDNKLYAFGADGTTNCTGTPAHCAPLWTGVTGDDVRSSPVVVGGVVYVGSYAKKLFAFDAAGVTNCTGTPVVCKPLWTAATTAPTESSPAVANGIVYVATNDGVLSAFDAAGTQGCSGVVKTCKALWTATIPGPVTASPAVVDGILYLPSGGQGLYAFDANGTANCTAAPRVCQPLWTAATAGSGSSPAVANGIVYLGAGDGSVAAFDAKPGAHCSGGPVVCQPRWTATTNASVRASPTVANGVLYVASADSNLYAFDADGVEHCSGSLVVCAPIWVGAGMASAVGPANAQPSPAMVAGTLYSSVNGGLRALRPCVNPEVNVGLAPCDLQNAYELPSRVAGVGMTVAIVDANHDPNAEHDLAAYRDAFDLPACPSSTGCFRQVNQLGVAGNYPPADVGWSLEISLDLQMVSAVCPLCKILLVESPNTFASIAQAEDTAVVLGANVVSNSFGANEVPGLSSLDSHFDHPGIPIVVSSGDGGYAAGPQYPAVVPSVTAVGGTTLTHTGTGRGWSETVWNEHTPTTVAGSGCSLFEAKPAWQTDTGCAQRTVADVAAVAGRLAVYDSYGLPGWVRVGGTSASTPIVAAIYALADGTTGAADVYAHGNLLFDVTAGTNGTCAGSYLCTGGAGYDGPTGLGTPCGVGAFGPAIASPAGCGGAASAATATLAPFAGTDPLAGYEPACRTAPPGGVRCLVGRQGARG